MLPGVAKQGYREPRTFQFSQLLLLPCQQGGWGRHKELGWDKTRPVDLNWPKNGHSTPRDIKQRVNLKKGKFISQWVVSNCLYVTCPISTYTRINNHQNYKPFSLFLFSYLKLLLLYFFSLNLSSISFFFFKSNSLSYPTGKGGNEQMIAWCSAACQAKPQQDI